MKTKAVALLIVVLSIFLALSAALHGIEPGYARPLAAPTPEWTPLAAGLPQAAGDGVAFILSDTLYHAWGWSGDSKNPIGQLYAWSLASASPSWITATTPLNPARFGAVAAATASRAYIVGGYGGDFLNNVDSFDGAVWRSERMLPQPAHFPAVAIARERLYVAGGLPGPVSAVWSAALNPDGTLGDWHGEAALPRGLTTRLVARGSCLYVVGGKDSNGSPHKEIYRATWSDDHIIAGWSPVGNLPIPLALHGVAVDQDTLYVLGGETANRALSDQVYSIAIDPDPQTCALVGDWTASALPGGGNRRVAVAARFGELYLLGGQTASGFTGAAWKGTLPTPEAVLTLSKAATVEGEFDYGKLITYTLSYANPWPHPDGQTGVVITDTIPVSTTFVPASAGVTPTERLLRWDIGTLAQGASGTVTFTERVAPPPNLDWALGSTLDYYPALSGTATLLKDTEVSYRITYTPTADAASDGIVLTATLPAQLFPLRTFPADIPYAVQGQNVIWRIPGTITETGEVRVDTCVRRAFSTQSPLTRTATLEDVLGHKFTLVRTQPLLPEVEGIIETSCTSATLTLAHPTTVPALYPNIVIRNQAWICSNELPDGCQPSNETITRYWPFKIFLPLTLRQ